MIEVTNTKGEKSLLNPVYIESVIDCGKFRRIWMAIYGQSYGKLSQESYDVLESYEELKKILMDA